MRKKKLAFLITILSSALAFATITSEGSFSVTLDTQPLLYMVISNTPVESMTFSDMLNSGHDQMTATYQAVSRDPTDTGYRLYVYNNTGGNCTLSVGIDHGLYKDNVDTNEIPWAIYIGPKDNINPDGKPKETSKSIYFASWLINKGFFRRIKCPDVYNHQQGW
jgi:hypothetical protein